MLFMLYIFQMIQMIPGVIVPGAIVPGVKVPGAIVPGVIVPEVIVPEVLELCAISPSEFNKFIKLLKALLANHAKSCHEQATVEPHQTEILLSMLRIRCWSRFEK